MAYPAIESTDSGEIKMSEFKTVTFYSIIDLAKTLEMAENARQNVEIMSGHSQSRPEFYATYIFEHAYRKSHEGGRRRRQGNQGHPYIYPPSDIIVP